MAAVALVGTPLAPATGMPTTRPAPTAPSSERESKSRTGEPRRCTPPDGTDEVSIGSGAGATPCHLAGAQRSGALPTAPELSIASAIRLAIAVAADPPRWSPSEENQLAGMPA